jgi:HEAT repeat protein
MNTETQQGYSLTLSVLGTSDLSLLSGFLGTVLNNQGERRAETTALFLAGTNHRSVNRLLIRRYRALSGPVQKALLNNPEGILQAARDLTGIDDAEIRKNVIEALADLADRRSIPLMLQYLDDPAGPVRERAHSLLHVLSRRYSAEFAASTGKERNYLRTALRVVLQGGDITTASMHTLLLLGRDGFLMLIPFLRDKTSASCEKIISHLRTEKGDYIARCLLYLSTSGYAEIRKLARDILKERQNSGFLASTARILGEYSEKELSSVAALVRYLSWENLEKKDLDSITEETQQQVLDVVRTFSGSYTQRMYKLIPFLKSGFVSIRASTLQLLCDVPAHLFFNELEPLLQDASEAIALRATSMLNLHSKSRAFELLVKQLGHRSALVREEAAKKLEGRTFHFLSRKWNDLPPDRRSRICTVLNTFDAKFPKQLQSEIESNDAMRILRALSIIRATKHPENYITILPDLASFPDPYVRSSIAALIGECRVTSTGTILTMLLKDPDPRVVANSIESIAKSRNKHYIPVLKPFLAHWNNRVRATAVVSLTKLGCTGIGEPLKAMMADPDTNMRKSAQWSIREIRSMIKQRITLIRSRKTGEAEKKPGALQSPDRCTIPGVS